MTPIESTPRSDPDAPAAPGAGTAWRTVAEDRGAARARTLAMAGARPADRMVDDEERLRERLQELELQVHEAALRGDVARLESLLHPAFAEVGRRGRRFERADLIERRAPVGVPDRAAAALMLDGVSTQVLQPGVVMLTYRSGYARADGSWVGRATRTSIWQWHGGGWRLRHHQGTAADEA